ncbi:LysR family transcriptional regulator [Azohydromonas aeria]|uniref:LysR family transcriptional regulator n=1 Tax=Azohydromonas aeria TaxID=2590212 RepID=UPI0012F96848|nr:LysR family transcriptional regulator [Azohydromonas aeria]
MRADSLQDITLRYFLEVVRVGSLTVASERLHVAASAISRQITALEQALGTPLFERRPRGMKPTAAGEVLAAYALRCSLEAERVVDAIRALDGLHSGQVRVATSEGFASEFLPAAISAFRGQHPRIRFEMVVCASAEVSMKVRQGEADIGLTFSRAAERDIRVVHRQAAPVLAIMRPDHELCGARSLTLARLVACPLALPDASTTLRQMIDIACSRQQLVVEPVLTTNHVGALLGFVLHGGGITMASRGSVRQLIASGSVVAVPIRDSGMDARDVELQVMVGRTLPTAVAAFLDHLQQALEASA